MQQQPSTSIVQNSPTSGFQELYGIIETRILAYAKNEKDEKLKFWAEKLVEQFQQRYLNWESSEDLSDYMDLLKEENLNNDIRLSGCIFLHLIVDLPVAIYKSLDMLDEEYHLNEDQKKEYRIKAREFFLEISVLFHEVLGERGIAESWLLPILQFIRPLRITAFQWTSLLRTVSWIKGEVMADLPEEKRQKQEEISIEFCTAQFSRTKGKALLTIFWYFLDILSPVRLPENSNILELIINEILILVEAGIEKLGSPRIVADFLKWITKPFIIDKQISTTIDTGITIPPQTIVELLLLFFRPFTKFMINVGLLTVTTLFLLLLFSVVRIFIEFYVIILLFISTLIIWGFSAAAHRKKREIEKCFDDTYKQFCLLKLNT
ncbi:MAG: hypothetical protein QNJ55_27645 [Xenococcus sp. MO_188.B8]|nr:hypothetical protein [Xenococcus sp. MO_188.B8]